jgi:hypothetical protein
MAEVNRRLIVEKTGFTVDQQRGWLVS